MKTRSKSFESAQNKNFEHLSLKIFSKSSKPKRKIGIDKNCFEQSLLPLNILVDKQNNNTKLSHLDVLKEFIV